MPNHVHLILTPPEGDAAAAGAARCDAGGLAMGERRGASCPPLGQDNIRWMVSRTTSSRL